MKTGGELPMEFEERLRQEFKSKADKLEPPLYLDDQIKQIFTNHFKNLSIEIYNASEVAISQVQAIKLTEGIRNQLAPGESAFVYIAELDKQIGNVPSLGFYRVIHPHSFSDFDQWIEIIKDDFEDIKLLTAFPKGFSFLKGENEGPTGGLTYENELKYYMALKERAMAENANITWQKAVPEDKCSIFKTPRFIYSNQSQEQIEISLGLVHGDRYMSIMPNPEKCQVANMEAYFSKIESPEIGVLKRIDGFEHKNGKTYSIHISTQSVQVTKEDLLFIADNLKWI